jgi:hypothetical protein
MTDRYRTADGWSVEVVRLSGTPDHHDGDWLRVCYFGSYVADVRTPEELTRYFPLSDLEPSVTDCCPAGLTVANTVTGEPTLARCFRNALAATRFWQANWSSFTTAPPGHSNRHDTERDPSAMPSLVAGPPADP